MNSRSKRVLIMAVMGAIGALYRNTSTVSNEKGTSLVGARDVLVATRDLGIEEVITPGLVKSVRMPVATVPAGAFSSVKDIEGRWVRVVVPEGKPVCDRALAPKGTRAFAIDVNQSVLPDQRVDVIRAVPADDGTVRAATILRDVCVSAVGLDRTRPDEPSVKWRAVTLAVLPDQMDALTAARDQGPLSLRIRGHEAVHGEERLAARAGGQRGVRGKDAKGKAVASGRPVGESGPGGDKSTAAPENDLTTEEIVARSEASVAVIRGKKSVGSGFLVRPGVLATNAHVIARQQIPDLRVTFPSAPRPARGPLGCELVYEDSKRDLAILSVKTDLRPLPIEDRYQFRRGQEVTVIGNPAMDNGDVFENAISRGVMSSRVVDQERLSYYQLNVSINPGNSGGPVLNPKGRVIGVASATVKSREALAICIPAADLEGAVEAAAIQPAGNRQRVLAIHGARGLLLELDDMGSAYYLILNAYTEGLVAAVRRGRDLRSANWDGQKLLDEKLRPLEDILNTSLYAQVRSVWADTLVPVEIRRDLNEVWSNCMEIRKLLYSPSDDYLAHVNRMRELGLIHKKRIKDLKETLNLR